MSVFVLTCPALPPKQTLADEIVSGDESLLSTLTPPIPTVQGWYKWPLALITASQI